MARTHHIRSDLESGRPRLEKSFKRGFGIVRMLTTNSQQSVLKGLRDAEIHRSRLQTRTPLHVTVIGFIGMSSREQRAFNAGFSCSRLEERLETMTTERTPRTALSVELGGVSLAGNLVYAEIPDDNIVTEQTNLAGVVALHDISPRRIERSIVPPHITIGFAQQRPAEEVREEVEVALSGQTIALERWRVYPERYA